MSDLFNMLCNLSPKRDNKTVDERMSWFEDAYDENKLTACIGDDSENNSMSLQNHKMNHIRTNYPYLIDLMKTNAIINKCVNVYINSTTMKSEDLIKMFIAEMVDFADKQREFLLKYAREYNINNII